MRSPVTATSVLRYQQGSATTAEDILVSEEPLEIRIGHGPLDDRREFRLSVTMRTPGHDDELALGFLFTEGIIRHPSEVVRIVPCTNVKEEERGNVVRAELRPDVVLDPDRWQRNFYTSSSCGVCGKTSIDQVRTRCGKLMGERPTLDPGLITALPERMRSAQTVFAHTGGIHAAALFDDHGAPLLLREDVGRHNAVDSLIGAALNAGLATDRSILLVSGRAGFELVQKCVMAGIPAMAAVGAPTSLAVRLAAETGLLLVGFVRGDRFNIYAGHL